MWTRAFLLVFAVGCADIDGIDSINDQISDDITAAENTLAASSLCAAPYSTHGRAFGLELSALAVLNVAPAPDTDITNPDNLAIVNLPLGGGSSLTDTLSSVEDASTSNGCSASDTATATTNQLSLSLPFVTLSATTLRASASSSASSDGVRVSSEGSLVQNLRINGKDYLNVSGPLTVTIGGFLGTPLAEVRVLETIRGNNTHDSASLQVNALHVIVLGGVINLVVSHAETEAQARTCGS